MAATLIRPKLPVLLRPLAAGLLLGCWLSASPLAHGQTEAAQPAPAPASAPDAPSAASAADESLASSLRAIFGELDGLAEVTVDAGSGVVHLGGEVLTPELKEQAVRLAREMDGVVEVDDDIGVVRDVRRRLAPAFETLTSAFNEAVSGLPLLAVALLVLFVFWLLARWVGRWSWLYDKLVDNSLARDWVQRLFKAALIITGIILALEILNATALVGAVLGAAGVVGLAVGFAFRDTVENYIAGLLLSVRQPFESNDHIEIEGREGRVVRLTPRATILLTFNGNHVRIPNAMVFKGVLVNYSRLSHRRFKVQIRVGTDVDLSQALDVGKAAVSEIDGVLEDPGPGAWIAELGDTYVTLAFTGWVDQKQSDYYLAQSESMRRIKESLAHHGMPMPEPAYRLNVAGGDVGVSLGGDPSGGSPGGAPSADAPQPGLQRDTSRSRHIERAVAEDRAQSNDTDLLDPRGARE